MAAIFLTSLVLGLLLQPSNVRWLKRMRIMDVPNARSSHATVTPRGGGIVLLVAIIGGLTVTWNANRETLAVLIAALALGAIGLTDDLRGVKPIVRLVAALAVGALCGIVINAPVLGLLGAPAFALWTATYVNAFNFMDGINGISGLMASVAGIAYLLMGLEYGSALAVALGAAVGGAAISFLPFNLPRARVFLGDVGSYSIGFLIAALGWIVWTAGAPLPLALAPTALYLADTGSTLVRRYRRGAPLSEPHREHTYQMLANGAGGHARVSLAIAMAQCTIVTIMWWGVVAHREVPATLLAFALLIGYLCLPALLALNGPSTVPVERPSTYGGRRSLNRTPSTGP